MFTWIRQFWLPSLWLIQEGLKRLQLLVRRDSCTSALSAVECQAGLSFQYAAAPSGLPIAEQALDAVLAHMNIIQITSNVLVQARTLVRRHRSGIGLRTLDAIHVASCEEIRAQIGAAAIEYVTGDKRQHLAFTSEGFSGTLLT